MKWAYYNEKEPFAAAWLRELIKHKLIAEGEVDERDIRDVRPCEVAGFVRCHWFAGIGGWDLALKRAAWPIDRPVWTGSTPCQPFSAAGRRRGFADERHLWPYWRYLIEQRRPATIFGEQVASAAEWLRLVRSDLEALGYAVGAIPVEAASAGADHLRDRYWFVADADYEGSEGRGVLPECAGERIAGPDGLVDSDLAIRWVGNQQPAGQFPQQQSDQEARDSGDAYEWVLGADGKARRVKSRLCVRPYGLPGSMAGMSVAAEYKEKIDGTQTQTDAASPLFAMRCATSAADVSERAGRFNGVFSPQVLQPELHGDAHAAVKCDSGGEQTAGAEISQRAVLRRMQDDTATARSSQGRQPAQQHTVEFADFMRFLPSAETLARLEKDTQTCEALLALRTACEGLWPVSKTLSSLEEVWRSLPDQAKREVWAERGEGRFVISPIQLLVQNFTGRIGALKGFGNAIDPRPAAEIIKTFLEYCP